MFFAGQFSLISPPSLLQLLCQEQRTVQIRSWRGIETAEVTVVDGLIVEARCGDLVGPHAVYQWAVWESGQFEVAPLVGEPPEATMLAPWEELVLEAARRRDELEQSLIDLPAFPQRAAIDQLLLACPAIAGLVLVGYDGRMLAAVGLDDLLVQQGPTVVSMLVLASRRLVSHPTVSLCVFEKQRLLFADWGKGVVALAVPVAGANIGEASSQLHQVIVAY